MIRFYRFLKKLKHLKEVVPARALPIVSCLENLQAIKAGCFGWELAKDYKDRIKNFTESVKHLKQYGQVGFKMLSYKRIFIGCPEDPGQHYMEDPHDVLSPGDSAK